MAINHLLVLHVEFLVVKNLSINQHETRSMRSFFSSLFFSTSTTLERDFIHILNQTQIFMILSVSHHHKSYTVWIARISLLQQFAPSKTPATASSLISHNIA